MAVEFTLSREQEMTRESVREFAQSVLKPRAAAYDRSREFPRDNWKDCAAMGLAGMMVPEEHGGAGFDCISYVIAIEEVARACASNPVAVLIPCHRAVAASGDLSGYRWGRGRKKTLLALERASRSS